MTSSTERAKRERAKRPLLRDLPAGLADWMVESWTQRQMTISKRRQNFARTRGIVNIDTLKADAINLMTAYDECLPAGTIITRTADQLVARHPGTPREIALVASEQAMWGGWP